jgi:hypothetical protein
MLSSAFHPRKSDARAQSALPRHSDALSNVPGHLTPAPKLEYVKLPGTKGALLIKSVETAKKSALFGLYWIGVLTMSFSFFAILCGENGKKVQLFAGTCRTALGLPRTFTLQDSRRSLELQLSDYDLVEVFLVFSQNVFGLEPATVRVREVCLGRAERRAAGRRARGARGEDASQDAAPEDDISVNVTVSVATAATGDGALAAPANEDGEGAPLEPGVQVSTHTISASAPADDQAANGGADTPTGAPTPTRAGSPTIRVSAPIDTHATCVRANVLLHVLRRLKLPACSWRAHQHQVSRARRGREEAAGSCDQPQPTEPEQNARIECGSQPGMARARRRARMACGRRLHRGSGVRLSTLGK